MFFKVLFYCKIFYFFRGFDVRFRWRNVLEERRKRRREREGEKGEKINSIFGICFWKKDIDIFLYGIFILYFKII